MKNLSLIALLVTLAACDNKQSEGEAIHARVVLAPSVSATCVLFEVREVATQRVLAQRWLPRTDDELRIAVFRGELPSDVELAARPYRDGSCQDGQEARTPNGSYVTGGAAFLRGQITQAAPLELKPGLDGDGDGYVSPEAGGADCGDGDKAVNPGAQEVCTDQVDLNCDDQRGCEASICSPQACIGPPTALALTLPASPVAAGECLGAAVLVKDANGTSTRVTSATTVSLEAAPSVGLALYADPTCSTRATSVTIAANEGGASFYFLGQLAGSVALTASATALTSATQNLSIVPGAGNRLVFTSSPRVAGAGVCSPVVQFQSQDAQGNPSPVSASTVITLMASPGTDFQFFSDSACTAQVASATLTAGESSASLYFKGTKSGSVTVTITAPGFTGSSQDEVINPGSPAAIALAGPSTVQAGSCSTLFSAELRDAYGNPTTTATSRTINLSSNGVPLTFSTSSECTGSVTSVSVSQGTSSAGFYVRGVQAGSATLTAASSGLMSGMQAVMIAPGPASVLAFTTAAQTVQAGSCSAVTTVQLRDSHGNPVSVAVDTAVALSASPPEGFQFFTEAGCAGTAGTTATLPAGSSSASFYFKSTRAGAATLEASVGSISGSQGVTINPAAPAVLAFPQSPLTVAAGACTQITLRVNDIHGNASNVGSNTTVGLAASPASGFTISSQNDCSNTISQVTVSSGQSSKTFYVSGTAAGSVTVTATATGLTSGTLEMTVNPGAPSQLGFVTAAQTILVGSCSGITTVEVQDSFSNTVPTAAEALVNLLASPSGNLIFYSDAGCMTPATSVTIPAGQSRASFYFKDSVVEDVTITAASDGLTSATQLQTINPLPPTALAFMTQEQSISAGSCSGVVTVEAQAQGSATTVTDPLVVALTASPATGFTFYSNSSCGTEVTQVTIATGQSSKSFYFKGTAAGTVTLTGASGSLTSATQNATITPLTPSKLLFTTPAHVVKAGTCSPVVTVQSADSYDNPSPVTSDKTVTLAQSGTPSDAQFMFYSDASCTTSITSVTILNGQTAASFYYRGEEARTVTLTASTNNLTDATQSHTVTGADATALVFSSSTPAQTLLAGTCALRTVEGRDAYGNPSVNAVIFDLTASAAAEFFSDSNCTSPVLQSAIPEGSSLASFYFKGYTGGLNANASLTLTASSTGLTSATQDETVIPTVRTGDCTIASNSKDATCSITPALANTGKAFLAFQATSSNQTSALANVRCYFNSTSQVKCARGANNTNEDSVSLRWSVAEFPSGVAVQHFSPSCSSSTPTNTTVAVSPAVVRDRTFLLLSSERNTTDQGNNIPRIAELTTTTQAEIRKAGDCGGSDANSLQVVEYTGASVQRGLTSLTMGTSTQIGLSPVVAPDRSILLYSYIYGVSGTKICDRVLRGELTDSGATVRFSRGEGDETNCAGSQFPSISWEVVQFPPGTLVQQLTQQLPAATASLDVTLPTPVDRSRTLVFAGGQYASGQLHGEGRYASGDAISDMRARAFLVDDSTLHITRATANDSATFTVFVVQLKP